MKKYFFLFAGIIVIVLSLNACKSNSTSSSDNGTSSSGANYFPNGDGNSYSYTAIKTDSASNKTTASRTVTYSGTSVVGSVTYQNEIDTITVGGVSYTTHSLFLKDNNGVTIVLDTTGFYKIIPASFQQYAQYISVGQTIKIFQSSFQDGTSWSVFDIGLKYNSLSLDLVNVVASYKGMEQVPLTLSTGTVNQSAAKIQYTLTIKIPDATNLLATPATSTYTAYAWFADNIGIVQIQGNATLIDAFTGSGISFADTTGNVSQSLIRYKVK
jgi:hypothetical protein